MSILLTIGVLVVMIGTPVVEANGVRPAPMSPSTPKVNTPKVNSSSQTIRNTPTSKYGAGNYKPSQKGVDYSRYEGKSYYNSSTGFHTTLLTALGTYLVLDSFSDNGDPVYADASTGETYDVDELDEQKVEPVEVDTIGEEGDDDSKHHGFESLIIPVVLIVLGILTVILML